MASAPLYGRSAPYYGRIRQPRAPYGRDAHADTPISMKAEATRGGSQQSETLYDFAAKLGISYCILVEKE